jgi:hypothetical protein
LSNSVFADPAEPGLLASGFSSTGVETVKARSRPGPAPVDAPDEFAQTAADHFVVVAAEGITHT